MVTFARWEEGLVVAKGNPKGVRRVQDLAKRGVRSVNREPGSGSRALLDRLLHDAGVPASKLDGYERVVRGHLAAAYSVASSRADSCLATRSAAQTFNLAFTPLEIERYDLVMRKRTLELPRRKRCSTFCNAPPSAANSKLSPATTQPKPAPSSPDPAHYCPGLLHCAQTLPVDSHEIEGFIAAGIPVANDGPNVLLSKVTQRREASWKSTDACTDGNGSGGAFDS